MSSHVETAIRDVAPTLSEPYPESVRTLTERLYASSRQKISLKPHEEVARYHLCAIVALNKNINELGITPPVVNNVPLPAKVTNELLNVFATRFDTPTPVSTPSRKRGRPSTSATPKSNKKLSDKENPFKTPSPKKGNFGRPRGVKAKTPFMKKLEAAAAAQDSALLHSPTKSSPLKKSFIQGPNGNVPDLKHPDADDDHDYEPQSPVDPEKVFLLLTSREITALCNKFQLESDVTINIINTFQRYYTKVANEWILICGLILNAYFVVHHTALKAQVGAKTTVFKMMFSLQNGGLMLNEIHSSVTIVQSIIEYTRWFKKLKVKYEYPEEGSVSGLGSNSMITTKYRFNSTEKKRQQSDWLDWVQHEIENRRTQSTR